MYFKKYIILLITILLTFYLIACSIDTNNEPDNSQQSDQTTSNQTDETNTTEDTENNNDSKTLPTKRDFKRYLEKKYGKSRVNGDNLHNYIFRSTYQKRSHGTSLSLIGSFN